MTTIERAGPAPDVPVDSATRDPGRRHHLGLDWVFTSLFGIFGWAVGLAKLSDNSFLWHLRTGEYILDHGIPHHDVFSYTAPGTKWIAQSWLAEVTYATLYRTFGGVGIRFFVAAVGAGIGVLSYRLALKLVRDRLVACGITAAALAGIYTVWSERPLLIGVLFLLVLLWVVEVPTSFVGRHAVLVLPVLMWLWANTHGTFELGFAYLALHLLGRWIDGARPWEGRERQLLLGSLVAGVVVFVNPYGISLVTFPLDLLSRGEILSHIVEWKSPDFREAWGFALAIWLCVYAFALARGRNRVTKRDLVVTLPMLFLALWAVRNVAVAPLICLPVVARAFARDEERSGDSGRLVGVALVVVVFAAFLMGLEATQETTFANASFPVKALEYVKHHEGLGTRLLTNDAAAGYVILHEYPEQKVFIDDRYDMYPTSVIYDYFTLSSGKPGWDRILDKYAVDTIVWKRSTPLASLLDDSSGWKRVYRNSVDAVWERTGTSS